MSNRPSGWAAFPFGWAFDVSATIAPGGPLAAILQATVGFMPAMTWLQVIAWSLYILIVGSLYIRGLRSRRPSKPQAPAEPQLATTSPSRQGAA